MSAGQIIETAKQANAEQLGQSKAGTFFAAEVNNAIKIPDVLTDVEKQQVIRELGYTPIFTNEKRRVTSDHPVLCALRETVRDEAFRLINGNSALPTLFVGCSGYELGNATLYGNPAYKFSIHGSEAKDMTRLVPQSLMQLKRKLKGKLNSSDKESLAKMVNLDRSKALIRFTSVSTLIGALQTSNFEQVPRVGYDIKPKVTRIVSFDSFYNMDKYEILSLFRDTGAVEGIFCGILPWELVFDNMPENDIYVYREFKRTPDNYATLSFRDGYCDGYIHKKKNWETLLRNKVLGSIGHSFTLNIELLMRAGPMTLIRLSRSCSSGHVYRELELPKHLKFVRVMDIMDSYKRNKNMNDLQHFPVREDEWWSLVTYLYGLDEKSVSVAHAVAYIRRHKNGINMSGVNIPPWNLHDSKVLSMAFSAVIFCNGTIALAKESMEHFLKETDRSGFFRFLDKILAYGFSIMTLGIGPMLVKLVGWLISNNLFEKLVLTPDMSKIQVGNLDYRNKNKNNEKSERIEIALDISDLGELPEDNPYKPRFSENGDIVFLGRHAECKFCDDLNRHAGKLGAQLISCNHVSNSTVKWSMTTEELMQLKNEYLENARAEGVGERLSKTLQKAAESIPSSSFTWEGKIELVEAGPGNGKSHINRLMYNDETLVYAPFGKLRSDYMSQERPDGSTYDMLFKTTHKGMEGFGKGIVAVDEWTCMDWRALLVTLHNNGAHTCMLYGDDRQTCIQPSEGTFIGLKFDKTAVSRHELMVNFRCPKWTIALLNKDFGYNIRAHKNILGKPIFHPLADNTDAGTQDITVMTFTHIAAMHTADQQSNSIRSNQGATKTKVGLIVSDADRNLINNDSIFRVAISRHTEELHIYVEPGTEMEVLMQSKLRMLDEEFENNISSLCKPDFSDLMVGQPEEEENSTMFSDFSTLLGGNENDIEWCTADIIKFYYGENSERDYKDFVLVQLGKYLSEDGKLVDIRAMDDFAKLKELEGFHVVSNYETLSENGRLPVMYDNLHVRIPTEKERKYYFEKSRHTLKIFNNQSTSGAEETCKIFKFNCRFLDIITKLEEKEVDVTLLTGKQIFEQMTKRKQNFAGRWKYEDTLVKIENSNIGQHAKMLMGLYGAHNSIEDFVPIDNTPRAAEPKLNPLQPMKDMYLMFDTFTPVSFFSYHLPQLNHVEVGCGFLNTPRNGNFINFVTPVNNRGHPVDIYKRSYKGQALTIGEGLHYYGDNPWQTMHAVSHRYLKKRKPFRYNNQAEVSAKKIARLFQKEHQTKCVIDHAKEASIVREWEFACVRREYEKRALGEKEWEVFNIRHHLKDIFKPAKDLVLTGDDLVKDTINTMKAGQGISAWSSEACIRFGAMTRIINHRWLSSLDHHVTYNNKYTDEEIDAHLRVKQSIHLPGAKTGVTDGADFDSMQNRYTQEIEREHSRYLGVPEDYLNHYYRFRNDYPLIQHGLFSAKAASEKTSGEPGTLLFNSQLGGSICNYTIRGVGAVTLEVQGDDAKKTQVGLVVNNEAMKEIGTYSHFKLKVNIGNNQEFCGNVEIDGTLVPSIHRMFKKISAKSFKGPKQFYEYKMSILDKIARIEKVGAERAIIASAMAVKVHRNEMVSLYDFIKSYSHISWEQYSKISMPVYSFTGTSNLLM